jgi:iron complex outermembrane recepter protein
MTYPTSNDSRPCALPPQAPSVQRRTFALGSLLSLAILCGGVLRAQEAAADPLAAAADPKTGEKDKVVPDEAVVLDTFVVTSIRASAIKALEVKRFSPGMVDAIVSEDIGKFPDNNVVESLQRVPGIQVTDYSGGNITHVTIRGLDDITTTLNGRNIFTASGLSMSLQDVPASLLAEVDVKKTRAASDIETGIAGVLDIRTHRPFDFAGRKFSIAAKGTYQEQGENYDPNLSALFSNTWKFKSGAKFGALINVSYLTTSYRDQSVTAGAQVPFMTDDPADGFTTYERIFTTDSRVSESPIWQAGLDAGLPSAAGSTLLINGVATEYVLSRDAIFQADANGKTKRPAANVSLQFAPDKDSEYTFELFYDGYRNDNFNNLLFSFVDWWGGEKGAVTLYPGTNIVKSRALVGDVYTFNSGDMTSSKTDSYQASLGGKWNVTPDLKLSSEAVFQTSEYNSDFFAMRSVRNSTSNISVDFNPGNGVASFSFPGVDVADPSVWNLGHIWDQSYRNKGSAVTVTEEGTLNVDWGWIRRLKFGLRYDDRKASEAARYAEGDAPWVSLSSYPELVYTTTGFFDGRSSTPSSWTAPNGYYLGSHKDEIRTLAGMTTSEGLVLAENFRVDEATTAAYLQVDEFTADLAGHRFSGQFGARFVDINTDMTYTGTTGNTGASKLLPSAATTFEITRRLYLRAAYGQTLRRPVFSDLNPNITYTRDVTNIGYGTASGGNPDLKPVTSTNYDVALEYYFDEATGISLAAFRRDIDDYIVSFRRRVTYTDDIGTYDYILTQPYNASNGKLQGVELGGKYYPKTLPGLLSGLGAEASYTWLDSSLDIPVTNSAGEVTGSLNTEFPSVSRKSYNLTLAYERPKFSVRGSYTWRSAFFHNNESASFANPLQIWYKAQRSLNAQISYRLSDNLVLTLEGTNLTNDIQQSYYGSGGDSSTTNNFGSWIIGRTYSIGIRCSF